MLCFVKGCDVCTFSHGLDVVVANEDDVAIISPGLDAIISLSLARKGGVLDDESGMVERERQRERADGDLENSPPSLFSALVIR